jgi:hypothetical protein
MSRKTLSAMILLAFVMSCTLGLAQEPVQDPQPEPRAPAGKTFKLLRDDGSAASDLDLGDEEAEAWVPGIRSGSVEVSLGVGFMNLNTTLLKHDQIIYKFTTESTFWGDVEITGASAFAPSLRLGYNVTNWFCVEGWSGVSISEYSSKITNTHRRKNEPDAPVVDNPPVGEFDAEKRSLITLQAGVNAVLYPLAIGGDGLGRWHPFVTAGAGNMWYNMNSNYSAGTASALDLNLGAGIRMLVDRNVSVRAQVLLHRNELEWTPAEYFTELNEGTTRVPLNEYPVLPDGTINERPVQSFAANTITALHWTIGIQGSF